MQRRLGVRVSEEAKRKISLALRGNKNAVGHIPRNKGGTVPKEVREKISKAMLGRKRGPYNWVNRSPRLKKPRNKPLKIRFTVLYRDGFKCKYCGRGSDETVLQVDHIFPKSRGGENRIENYITACRDCNIGKGDAVLSLTI